MKYRVYNYYVGCRVYNVEADTPSQAYKLRESGEGEFLHDANEPDDNPFFNEVFEYEENGLDAEVCVYTHNPACAKIWHNIHEYQPADYTPKMATPEQMQEQETEGYYRECACALYASDEIEIDGDAKVSQGDEGAFVQAWVWVPREDGDEV